MRQLIFPMSAFSIPEAIKYGWKTTKEHFIFLAGLIIGTFVISAGFNYTAKVFNNTGNDLLAFAITALAVVVGTILGMGLIYIALKLYDKNTAEYSDILKPAPLLWRYIASSIMYAIIVLAGLILFIVPGIIWAIKYGFYKYTLIDEKLDIMDSIRRSGEITRGEKWNIFFFGIVLVLLNILGALVFLVGLIITVPITMMATAYVYRKLLHSKTPEGVRVS